MDVAIPKERLLTTLKETIAIPSVNPPGNEAPMVDYVEAYLKRHGFEVERVHAAPGGRDTLIAILPGKVHDDGIIFTGHMDVVQVNEKELERWDTDPFDPVEKEGYLYGRGSSDMKSGLVAALTALCDLKDSGVVPPRDLALVATIDEEDGMMGSRAVIGHESLKGFKWVVVCEPTQLECCTIGRGRTYGELHFKGKTAHGSRPGSGINAILLANEFINRMMEADFSAYENEHGTTFWRPLAISAGVEPCVVPDTCTVKIDARLTVDHYPDDIWERVDALIEQVKADMPGADVTYEVIDKREPWRTPKDCFIVNAVRDVTAGLGFEFVDTMFSGTTDGTPLRRDGREAVIIGPGDLSCVHQENERLWIQDLYDAYALYSRLMLAE